MCEIERIVGEDSNGIVILAQLGGLTPNKDQSDPANPQNPFYLQK